MDMPTVDLRDPEVVARNAFLRGYDRVETEVAVMAAHARRCPLTVAECRAKGILWHKDAAMEIVARVWAEGATSDA